jgi:hypothetical protein
MLKEAARNGLLQLTDVTCTDMFIAHQSSAGKIENITS